MTTSSASVLPRKLLSAKLQVNIEGMPGLVVIKHSCAVTPILGRALQHVESKCRKGTALSKAAPKLPLDEALGAMQVRLLRSL